MDLIRIFQAVFSPNGMPQFNYSNEWTKLLQRIYFSHAWIYGGDGAKDVGVNDTEIKASFDVPLFQFPDHFLITPGFALHLWDGGINVGPGSTDLPAQTYDAFLETAWAPKFNNRVSADLAVRVGVYTDFDHFATDSFRIMGRGLGVINIDPRLQFKAGIIYLDRNDIKMLPAGGLIWDPSRGSALGNLLSKAKSRTSLEYDQQPQSLDVSFWRIRRRFVDDHSATRVFQIRLITTICE